jgi:tetratricopeptide (TPR) repeat protein
MKKITQAIVIFAFLITLKPLTQAESVQDSVSHLQKQWAQINYQVPTKAEKIKAFRILEESAQSFIDEHPTRVELKIWKAIILSTDAGVVNGLSSLGMLTQAKKLLLESIEVDANALSGSAYTSLASLYYQSPRWPVSFGNKKKAQNYFSKALQINPMGIDPNYFYGDFLYQKKDYAESQVYLKKALLAKPRLGRELADEGRRQEIRAVLAKVSDKLK